VLFQSVNLASASLWALVVLAPGAGLADHLSR
jgi:membrane protein DedA with SNARE-associated domain